MGRRSVSSATLQTTPLPRASAAENDRDRHADDEEISPDREILDVVPLDGEAFRESQLAAAVHLHGTGDSWFELESKPLLSCIAFDEIELLRARPHQAHVSDQHVPELRELVEAPPPQRASDTRDTGIVTKLEHRLVELVERNDVLKEFFGVGDH